MDVHDVEGAVRERQAGDVGRAEADRRPGPGPGPSSIRPSPIRPSPINRSSISCSDHVGRGVHTDRPRHPRRQVEPAAEDGGQTLRLSPANAPARVFGDRDLLMQMLSNLVENGLRHCPRGSRIAIVVDAGAAGPVLSVSDNGPGIAATDTDKVFRRFYRGEKSRTGQGHGLGLAMVRAIGDLHGATVAIADNTPGLTVRVGFAGAPGATPDRMGSGPGGADMV